MSDIVEEARVLLEAATPGPWRTVGNTVFIDLEDSRDTRWWALPGDQETAEFIAAAPRLVAGLLAEYDRAREVAIRSDGYRADLSDQMTTVERERDESQATIATMVDVLTAARRVLNGEGYTTVASRIDAVLALRQP